MSTAAIRRHWTQVAAMGCVVCQSPAEIAHCHNGSIRVRMGEPKAKGRKLPRYDWLVIPLCAIHHRDTSPLGLDRNVRVWEDMFGSQAKHLDRIAAELGIDVWAKAREGAKTRIAA